jgi:hypothetical protein
VLLLWPCKCVTLRSGLSRNVECVLVIFKVWGRQTAPSDYLSLFGFPSGPTKVVEIIVLQLLQCIFALLKKLSESVLFSSCSKLYVMNLCFIVIKYLLF